MKPFSTDPKRAPARAMMRATGQPTRFQLAEDRRGEHLDGSDPCNMHLRTLGEAVKRGIHEAGGKPVEFNTIAVSDGTHGNSRNVGVPGFERGDCGFC